jgi:hypothetical protein
LAVVEEGLRDVVEDVVVEDVVVEGVVVVPTELDVDGVGTPVGWELGIIEDRVDVEPGAEVLPVKGGLIVLGLLAAGKGRLGWGLQDPSQIQLPRARQSGALRACGQALQVPGRTLTT